MRALNSAIEPDYRERAAQQAANIFVAHSLYQKSQRIACYLARHDEFDSMPFVQAMWQDNKQCFLPVISSDREKHLDFVPYQEGDALRYNQFHILEPKDFTRTIAPETFDIIIAPLIAFDGQGHRLGTGAGYYDRTLAFLHERKHQKPYFIGIAYQLQKVDEIPADPWDVKLDAVVTEEGWTVFDGLHPQ